MSVRHISLALASALAACLLPVTAARAAVNVGDRPAIDWSVVDGGTVRSRDLAGRLVVIHFWASWWSADSDWPNLIAAHRKYQPLGVAFLGVSADRARQDLRNTVRTQGVSWPQVWDSRYYHTSGSDSIVRAWTGGISNRVYVLGPDGKVLWVGLALSRFSEELGKLVEQHPTVHSRMRQALQAIDQAHQALRERDYAKALERIRTIDESVRRDEGVARRLRALGRSFPVTGEEAPQAAAALAADPDAARLIGRSAAAAPPSESSPAAGDAGEPSADRAASADAAASSADSAPSAEVILDRLDQAVKAAEASRHDQALRTYQWLVDHAPDSEAAHTARQRIEAYRTDPQLKAALEAARREDEARRLLTLARNYLAGDQRQLARENLQHILDHYADTSVADEARRLSDQIK